MKKTVFNFALALALAVNTAVFASGDTEFFSGGKITLSGKAEKNASVTVTVLKEGVTADEFNASDAPETLCLCYREVKANEKGDYTLTFDIGTKSAVYEVYTGETGKGEPEHSVLKYVNETENASALALLSAVFDITDEDEKYAEFENVIKNNTASLGINKKLAETADIKKSAEIFFAGVSKDGVNLYESAKGAVDKAMAVSLFNEGKISLTGEFEESFNLPESAEKYLKKDCITDETRAMIDEKTKKTSADFASFDKAAAEGIALGVIYSADGAGNVKNCLTDNAELLGIDKTKVTDEFAESIIGKKFDAISKIGIDSFVPDEKPIQGGGSKGSPSKGGVSNSGISGITPPAAEPIDKSSKEFTDLDGFEWAQNAINTLRAEGILNGMSEGISAPSELVLREEFLKMLLSAVTFEELDGAFDFDDVKSDDWYYGTVKKAYLCKIVNGMSERMFGSGNAVSRQDMAVMCYNALIKKGVITGGDAENAFADAEDIAPYAKEAVSYLNSIKIVNGDENGRFNPNGTATRAESAQMIYNIIEFMKNK